MEKMKTLYADCETTGTDPKIHDVIQFAAILEKPGRKPEEHEWFMRPENPDTIEQEALDVIGRTREEIMAYPSPIEVYPKILDFFDKHIQKFNRKDKLIWAGANIQFDKDFMAEYFRRRGNPYFFSYVHPYGS